MYYPMIEIYRRAGGWTCEELARQLHVSRGTFYNWRKKGVMPLDAIYQLCDLFCCSPSMLLSRVVLLEDPVKRRRR